MTATLTCPACATVHPVPEFARDPHYCSIACYRTGPAQPDTRRVTMPSRHPGPSASTHSPPRALSRRTAPTPAGPPPTGDAETPAGTPVTVPATQPRRPITVYECDNCGTRALGEQRCEDCATFMHRVGIGGHCPACDEPVAITELLDTEETA